MGFNATKLKVQLKLAVQRLKMLQQKKTQQNALQRKEVAQLLEKGKIESARIRVEHVIREDYNNEALEMLEIYCEMLLARFGLIETLKTVDPSIKEACCSICYAAARSEVPELLSIRDQLVAKYGKLFAQEVLENRGNVVNERLIQKMKITTPEPKIVNGYLSEIARSFNVIWEDATDDFAVDSSLIGSESFGGDFGGGSGGGGGGDLSFPPIPQGKQGGELPPLMPLPPTYSPLAPPTSAAWPPPSSSMGPADSASVDHFAAAAAHFMPRSAPQAHAPTSSAADDDDISDFDELQRRLEGRRAL